MLRKTASTLWTRFVPAARQAYPAAASSMKRPRWFSATTEDGGEDGGEDVEEYEDDEEEWEYDEHAPPLNLFGLPARYASAVYTAASKEGVLERVQSEIKTLVDAANMDEKFRNFLYDPTMPKAKKIAGITEFCDGAGFDKITKSFLCVTAENGRLKETSKILGCLEEYSLKAAGQVKATVTSAFPLNEDQLTRLTGLIKKKLDDPEDELTVETKVDSKLVGGFTVAMGEDFYDLSLMTRLRHMENELAKPLR